MIFTTILAGLNWHYSIAALFVGALVGFTGVGGGALMTPILVLLFGFSPATAVGTDLLFAAATKTFGTVVHGSNKTVDWRITRRLAAGSVPAAGLTLLVLAWLGNGHKAGGLITTVLGCALILTAAALLLRKWALARLAVLLDDIPDSRVRLFTNLLGAVLGVLVTISSVGAGAIGVTVLLILYPKLSTARIVGSDIAHAVPLTLIAGAGHWFLGSIDWSLLGSLLVGSVPGIVIGSQLAAYVPDRVLRPVLAGTLAIVGAKLAI